MRTWLISCVTMCFSALAHAQAVPEIPFDSVADPLKLPADMYFGEVAGIAVNSKKHIFTSRYRAGIRRARPMEPRQRSC